MWDPFILISEREKSTFCMLFFLGRFKTKAHLLDSWQQRVMDSKDCFFYFYWPEQFLSHNINILPHYMQAQYPVLKVFINQKEVDWRWGLGTCSGSNTFCSWSVPTSGQHLSDSKNIKCLFLSLVHGKSSLPTACNQKLVLLEYRS